MRGAKKRMKDLVVSLEDDFKGISSTSIGPNAIAWTMEQDMAILSFWEKSNKDSFVAIFKNKWGMGSLNCIRFRYKYLSSAFDGQESYDEDIVDSFTPQEFYSNSCKTEAYSMYKKRRKDSPTYFE